MNSPFRAIQVSDHVWWVGAIDWDLADFHGYSTPRGSTYNAFLIDAETVTLVDTVKTEYVDELMARISSFIHPERIDLVVSNHSEPDHTSGLAEVIRLTNPKRVVASKAGVKALAAHYSLPVEVEAVGEGQTIDLGGGLDLVFHETRMAHWPDSMMCTLGAERVLFSNDIFGLHLAGGERFDGAVDPAVLLQEATAYYANIFWPVSPAVAGVLKKIDALPRPPAVIAPDHGPVWRDSPGTILDLYRGWVEGKTVNKAVVVYDTMWGSTAKLAHAAAEGLIAGGMGVKLLPLSKSPRSEIAAELLEASALLVGTSNLNGRMLPRLADVLTYLGGLKPKSRPMKGAVFGSYGWADKASRQVREWLEAMQVELVADPLSVNYVPDREALNSARKLGKQVAQEASVARSR